MVTPESSISDTVRTILGDVEQLVRSELRLARAELRAELSTAAKRATFAVLALGFGILAAAFALFAVFFVLRGYLPAWVSALLMCVLAAMIAGALVQAARSYGPPSALPRTATTVKENIEWAKQQPR